MNERAGERAGRRRETRVKAAWSAIREGRGIYVIMARRFISPIFLFAAMTAPAWAGETLDQALGAPSWLHLDLIHRTRYETLHNQFYAGRQGDDQILTPTTFLKIEAGAPDLKFVAELIDSRGYGDDRGSGVSNGVVDPVELLQAHLYASKSGVFRQGDTLAVTAGRFTTALGSGRLVGRNQYRNVPDTFTGLRADWTSPRGDALTLLWALPVTRRPNDITSLLDNRVVFDRESPRAEIWSAFYTRKNAIGALSLDAYVIGLLERDDNSGAGTRNRRLYAPGLRLYSKPRPGTFDVEIEGIVQRGLARATANLADVGDLSVHAGLAHARFGYTFKGAWSPQLSLELDYGSGDRDPNDRRYGRFDSLFSPLRADLGPGSLFSFFTRTNALSPGLRLEARPTPRLDLRVDTRAVLLAALRDRLSSTGLIDATGAAGRFAGQQNEARLRYVVIPDRLTTEIGGAYVARGRFLKDALNTTGEGDPLYGYAQFTMHF